jgi:hypothetical protein
MTQRRGLYVALAGVVLAVLSGVVLCLADAFSTSAEENVPKKMAKYYAVARKTVRI